MNRAGSILIAVFLVALSSRGAHGITVGGRDSSSLEAAADRILSRPPTTGITVPLPFATSAHSVEEDLIRWELIRAARLGGGTDQVLDAVSLSLADNPALTRKIKEQYAALHAADKKDEKKADSP